MNLLDSSTWLKHGDNSPTEEAHFCNLQDRNIFKGAELQCQHCGTVKRTVDHLATRCDRMLAHDYMRRHNEVVRSIHLQMANKYRFKRSRKIKNNEITIIEVEITSQDQLQRVEAEKHRKYDLLAKELGTFYRCRTRIIPYVMTWDGVVTNFRRRYRNDLEITPTIEAYIQSRVLKTTLGAISSKKRRGILDGYTRDDEIRKAVGRLGIAAMGTTEAW